MGRGRKLYVFHYFRASWQGNVTSSRYCATADGRNGANGLILSRKLNTFTNFEHRNFVQNGMFYPRIHLSSSSTSFNHIPPSSVLDFGNNANARNYKRNSSRQSRLLEITQEQARDAFKYCLELAKCRDRDNYLAALTMPLKCRPEILSLLAFNIEIAVIREKISSERNAATAGIYRLQFWRDAISAIYGKSVSPVPRQPVAIALCSFAPRASFSLLESLVIARQQTISDKPFSTVESLAGYGMATVGALIRLEGEALARRSAIGKPPKSFDEAADQLGAAYGIMNIIRSFLPLLARGIVVLPADLLQLHNLTPDRLYNRKDPVAATYLVKDMVHVALAHIRASKELSPSIPRVLCPSLAAPNSVVEYIIGTTKKVNYNIYDPGLQRQHPFLIWSLLAKKFLDVQYTQQAPLAIPSLSSVV